MMCPVILVCIAFGLLGVTNARKCYDCTHQTNKNCSDPFNAAGVGQEQQIEFNTGVCAKLKWESDGGASVSRKLLREADHVQCTGGINGCFSYKKEGIKATICCCDRDLCNGASTNFQGWLLLGICLLILKIRYN